MHLSFSAHKVFGEILLGLISCPDIPTLQGLIAVAKYRMEEAKAPQSLMLQLGEAIDQARARLSGIFEIG